MSHSHVNYGEIPGPRPSGQEVIRHSAIAAQSLPPSEMQAWESYIRRGTAGAVYLHPQLVLADLEYYQGCQIFTLSGPDGLAGELSGLAVLTPKSVVVRPLPLPFCKVSMNGYRLAGDQVVGTDETEVVRLVKAISRLLLHKEAECLLFEDIEHDSILWKAILLVAAEHKKRIGLFHRRPPQLHHLIRFPNPSVDYWKKFTSKTRGNLRRMAAKFEHRLLKFTSPDDVLGFLERAHLVSTKSWQAAHLGVRIQNTPKERKYWSHFAALGGFRSYILEHAGAPVAFVLGTCWNGCFTYEEIAYDQSYLQYSPGNILLFRILEDMIAGDTPRVFEFGAGDGEYKKMFSTHQLQSGPILLVRRPRPAIYLQIEQLSGFVVRAVRAVFRSIGVLTYLRRRRRRRP
jgi:Acetyltransferase (GNAT) domain